jgi:hypothetical protein
LAIHLDEDIPETVAGGFIVSPLEINLAKNLRVEFALIFFFLEVLFKGKARHLRFAPHFAIFVLQSSEQGAILTVLIVLDPPQAFGLGISEFGFLQNAKSRVVLFLDFVVESRGRRLSACEILPGRLRSVEVLDLSHDVFHIASIFLILSTFIPEVLFGLHKLQYLFLFLVFLSFVSDHH